MRFEGPTKEALGYRYYSTPKGQFELALEDLTKGDNDSLVEFYQGLCHLARRFRRTVEIRRTSPTQVLLLCLDNGKGILRFQGESDNLSRDEVERYAENRDEDSLVNRLVYDLLDDAWRKLNGQEIDGDIVTQFARP